MEESQFADADEESNKAAEIHGGTLSEDATAVEEDEDSDEQCVSFRAKSKKSSRIQLRSSSKPPHRQPSLK
jgi:hypothetical protein